MPWKALLAVTAARISQIGRMPRSRAAAADSTTRAAAPEPMIIPCLRRSKGRAASSTTASVAAAPLARNPDPTQGSRVSEATSSAETTTTRRQRPALIQSSATHSAWEVLAQAAFTCVFGPRAPMSSANCECPMDRTRNRKRRSKVNGSACSRCCSSATRLSTSATRLVLRAHPGPDVLEHAEFVPAGAVLVVVVEIVREGLVTGERGREDHSGVVAHVGGQPPAIRQPGAERRGVVVPHQRDARVAQRVHAGADGQPGALVERGVPVGVDAELRC